MVEHDPRLPALLRSFSRAASVFVIAVGGLVLAGWALQIDSFKSLLPGLATMKANTALAFVGAGASLWLRLPVSTRAEHGRRIWEQECAWLVTLTGLLTLGEHLLGVDLGIDQLLFRDAATAVAFFPGRMAPATALNFLLIGAALLLWDVRLGRAGYPTEWLTLGALLVAMVAMLGYTYGVQSLYRLATYSSVAPHTALTFAVMGLGILAARPEQSLMALVTSSGPGGLLTRRLLPAAIFVPPVLGALRLAGQRAGLYDTEMGLALYALGNIATFTVIVVWSARVLERVDRERQNEARKFNAELEQRVAARTAQLEAANKELEAFSYSVSHDLRAPLRAIDGFSRLMLEDYGPQLEAEAQRYLKVVRENTQQMGQLIDDLLAFAHLNRQALETQRVETAQLARRALAEVHADQNERLVEIMIGDLPPCQGDPTLLKQVFVNLLSNALKFTRERTPARIEVGYAALDTEHIYFVRDNGAGFDMQFAHKLFGVFQRLHRAEDYEGTGVGLAIVQRIIHRHGGRIWAEAEVGKGATFYFTLPRAEHVAPPPIPVEVDLVVERARELV